MRPTHPNQPWLMLKGDEVWGVFYRVTRGDSGAWFVVPPGVHWHDAVSGQPFTTRRAAGKHVEFLVTIDILEGE